MKFFTLFIAEAYNLNPSTPVSGGLVLKLPGMSTKQPTVAVVSHSNQQSPFGFCAHHWLDSINQAFNSGNLSNKCSKS